MVAGPGAIERLNRVLDSIPDREAEVVRLRVHSELSFAEIAIAVGVSVPTVKSRFRYGLDKLRRALNCGKEEPDALQGSVIRCMTLPASTRNEFARPESGS